MQLTRELWKILLENGRVLHSLTLPKCKNAKDCGSGQKAPNATFARLHPDGELVIN
jgi:hypothetical protein